MNKLISPAVVAVGLIAAAQMSQAAEWSYEGEHGPEHWGSISEEYATCGSGQMQSPFDISSGIHAALAPINFQYGEVPITVTNNGHSLQVNVPDGNSMEVDGKTYKLLQFHFHTPSEHAIDGKRFPMVMHMVHQADDGSYAVVGVMMEEGEANAEIAALWDVAPATPGEASADGTVDVPGLLPEDGHYMRFMGSLTTPPCTEGINWHMMSTPITVSAEQIAQFAAIFPMDARPLQPENHRLVVLGR